MQDRLHFVLDGSIGERIGVRQERVYRSGGFQPPMVADPGGWKPPLRVYLNLLIAFANRR